MKHSKELLEQMQTYSAKIRLEASLVDYARTTEQADWLLKMQERAKTLDRDTFAVMAKYKIKEPGKDEAQAFKKLNELIEYCSKFAEPEAYESVKLLQAVKLPLATDSSRYKLQQMKTDTKQDYINLLKNNNLNFENIEQIASSLLKIASI